jgi:lipid-A-disaccharide synthase-like uncharacterized protein
MSRELWLSIGFLGQVAFTMRFAVQWVASERKRQSVVPLAFWWFSIAGGAILTAYAIHLRDPVFTIGQGAGLFIYVRNLQLIRRHALERRAGTEPTELP